MSRRSAVAVAAAAGFALACGGPAYAYWTASADPVGSVSAAVLQAPGASYDSTSTAITVHVAAPASGPAPSKYVVSRGGTDVCTLTAPGDCADPTAPAVSRSYTVTAWLGAQWKVSTTLTANTRPPDPQSVGLSSGSDSGISGDGITNSTTPQFTVGVTRATNDYTVVVMNGSTQVGAPVVVSAGTGTTSVTISTPSGAAFPANAAVSYPITAHALYAGLTSGDVAMAPRLAVWGPPAVSSVGLDAGGTPDGKADAGDTVTITFSQALNPSTVCSTWGTSAGAKTLTTGVSVVLTDHTAADTLAVSAATQANCSGGFNLGAVSLAADYLTKNGNNSTATFTGSQVGLSSDWKTLTITLGTVSQGDANLLNTVASGGTPTLTPSAPNPKDEAGSGFSTTAAGGTTPSSF